jgi:hypothetical protein
MVMHWGWVGPRLVMENHEWLGRFFDADKERNEGMMERERDG